MNKNDYKNTIELQIKSLPDLVLTQADSCFNKKKLEQLIPEENVKKIKKVIITGCGDSFSAAGVIAPMFKKYSRVEECIAPDTMEYTRFYTKQSILNNKYNADEILVITVSASGGADRIAEILAKANAIGLRSLLITNRQESRGASIAQRIFNVETPPLSDSPGLRSYFASMLALIALAEHIGVVKGNNTEDNGNNLKQAIIEYLQSFKPVMEEIDDQIFQLAGKWNEFRKFEIVGDDSGFYSAQFTEQTLIECTGAHAVHTDSEDWCHINFFLRNPANIPTVFKVDKNLHSYDRIKESVRVAVRIGRPVLVVTNASRSEFPSGAVVCTIPTPKEGYPELFYIADYIPDTLLAGYCAALSDRLFFGGRFDYRKQIFIPDVPDGIVSGIGSSKITIVV